MGRHIVNGWRTGPCTVCFYNWMLSRYQRTFSCLCAVLTRLVVALPTSTLKNPRRIRHHEVAMCGIVFVLVCSLVCFGTSKVLRRFFDSLHSDSDIVESSWWLIGNQYFLPNPLLLDAQEFGGLLEVGFVNPDGVILKWSSESLLLVLFCAFFSTWPTPVGFVIQTLA